LTESEVKSDNFMFMVPSIIIYSMNILWCVACYWRIRPRRE